MSLYKPAAPNSAIYNACINLGVVDASSASVVDVSFYQYYRKYYDRCYIDWRTSSTGEWNAMAINVEGNDVDINSSMRGFVTYTLPVTAAGHSYLELRLRYFSDVNSGNTYGYFWIIDDVTITAGSANRLKYYDNKEEYVYGGYGIIPQNMQLKPTWYMVAKNNGANVQNNVTVKMNHMSGYHSAATVLGSCNNGTMVVGETKELLFTDFASSYYQELPMIRLLVGPANGSTPDGIDKADDVKIELYPNPTNGPLNINSSETISRVEVYNNYGQQVRNVETGSTSVQLNLSELAAGTYILNIHTSSGVTHKRITVK